MTLLLAVAAAEGVRAELVDRVMAVVDRAVITLSDVNAAARLRLVDAPARADQAAVLDRLIERRLTLTEVSRYAPPDPSEAQIDERLREVRAPFASDEQFDQALAEVGLTVEQLRAHLRDDLRIAAYLLQRFGPGLQPSEAEVLQYYRTHPGQFMPGGVMLTFDQARDAARAALIAERRAAMIREWLDGLRRRADITIPAIVKR